MSSDTIGRPAEFRAIEEFLQSATLRPAALVIEGESGVGKTTLWLAGVAEARERGFQVLQARAGQAETTMAYAAVADLLGDVESGVLAELPDVQRVAVDRVCYAPTARDRRRIRAWWPRRWQRRSTCCRARRRC